MKIAAINSLRENEEVWDTKTHFGQIQHGEEKSCKEGIAILRKHPSFSESEDEIWDDD
jgi:hypothetical protein